MVNVEWFTVNNYQEAIEKRRKVREETECDTSRIYKCYWGKDKGRYRFGVDRDSKPLDICPYCKQKIMEKG